MPRTIFYVFAGRQPNIEVALPFYRRILETGAEVHIWDLARDPKDSEYLRSITGVEVRTQFYQGDGRASRGQNRVWKHYTRPEYSDCVFVKVDDDVLFLETEAFDSFVQAAVDNPNHVISALTINNGASTSFLPDIQAGFEELDIPLLDVHLSPEYAELCHRWFFQNWRTITGKPAVLTPVETWLSINCIAYTYEMGRKIAIRIGTRSPRDIADRHFDPYRTRVGDEGAANMQPRMIHEGFVAGHLNFGPQQKAMPDDLLNELRKLYADVAKQYL